MRWKHGGWLAVLCAVAMEPLRAETLQVNVVHSEAGYDLRAVRADGTAYALNLSRGSSELWASTDNARTWRLRGISPTGGFKQVAALSDGVLLADTQSASGFTLVRSADGGASWSPVLALGRYRLLTPRSIDEAEGTVYLAEYQDFSNENTPTRLWASEDRGRSWSIRSTFVTSRHAHAVRAAPDGALWLMLGDRPTQSAIVRSTDGGRTWTTVLAGEEARAVDGLFLDGHLLYGQDIPDTPLLPWIALLAPEGSLSRLLRLPGPSYSVQRAAGGGFLMGTTREPLGGVYAEGDVSAHLLASPDGLSWSITSSHPRISSTDYARADSWWMLPTGEAVLSLRNVQTLPGGRGYQLLATRLVDDAGRRLFRDGFVTCPLSQLPGPGWVGTGWSCRPGAALSTGSNVLTRAPTEPLAEAEVSAEMLATSVPSGLIARASESAHYRLQWEPAGRLSLWRRSDGADVPLTTRALSLAADRPHRLRLTVAAGSTARLEGWVDDVLLLSADDPTPLPAGQGGLWSGGAGARWTSVAIAGRTSDSPPEPPAQEISDDFDSCTSSTDLGLLWQLTGRWYCRSGRARSESPAGLALHRTKVPSDISVQSRVQLNGDARHAGVVARATAASALSTERWYAARIAREGRVELVRRDAGGEVVLGSVARTIRRDVSYLLSLRVQGRDPVRLEAAFAGQPVLSASDTTTRQLTTGAAGLVSDGPAGFFVRTQFDDFRAGP